MKSIITLPKVFYYIFLFILSFLFFLTFYFNESKMLANQNSLSEFSVKRNYVLPEKLAKWSDNKNSGNYFDQIKKLPIGYLIWSDFPVKIYVESLGKLTNNYEGKRAKIWIEKVTEAIKEWDNYLSLEIVDDGEKADIMIKRSRPDIKAKFNQQTGKIDISRARSAETSYKLYMKKNDKNQSILAHKFIILIKPDQADNSILASARHEIGHALGIWGHSLLQTDVMYFSQVRNPPLISPRDVNTLKLIYQQETSLGTVISNQ